MNAVFNKSVDKKDKRRKDIKSEMSEDDIFGVSPTKSFASNKALKGSPPKVISPILKRKR
jgi:hypothetical protein